MDIRKASVAVSTPGQKLGMTPGWNRDENRDEGLLAVLAANPARAAVHTLRSKVVG